MPYNYDVESILINVIIYPVWLTKNLIRLPPMVKSTPILVALAHPYFTMTNNVYPSFTLWTRNRKNRMHNYIYCGCQSDHCFSSVVNIYCVICCWNIYFSRNAIHKHWQNEENQHNPSPTIQSWTTFDCFRVILLTFLH